MDVRTFPVVTRRDFIRAAGLLAGAAVALPILQGATGPGAATALPRLGPLSLRLGVLLPQSAHYPHLGRSLLSGLQLYFEQVARWSVDLRVADTDRGVGSVLPAADRLLTDDKVDLLVGMVNPEVAAQLHERLAAGSALFINAHTGANVPRQADQSPYVFTHTLALWQGSWALGRWAARTLGRRAVLAASVYDSGYDTPYAFRLGFEGAGGQVVATHITHHPLDDPDPTRLVAPLAALGADFVYAAYSGRQAIDFVRAYAAGPAGHIPLVGPGFLTDEHLLAEQGEAAIGVRTVASWSGDGEYPESRQFVAAYRERTGSVPDAFALLGFETAQLIVGAAASAGGAGGTFPSALAAARFAGPRGEVVMDRRTRSATGPLYLRQVRETAGGLVNAVLGKLPLPSQFDDGIEELRNSLKTGWSMPYLCG